MIVNVKFLKGQLSLGAENSWLLYEVDRWHTNNTLEGKDDAIRANSTL